MENINFVAFDFETADKDMPCQLGITKVRRGEIIESKSWLIKPPHNQYNFFTIAVHGITPDKTENAPLFPEIWHEIKEYLENNIVVAHNASFDLRVLRKAAEYYNMDISLPRHVICTCSLHGRQNLADCCARYGIEMIKHHDANSDSDACANILLNYVDQNDDQQITGLFKKWTSQNLGKIESEDDNKSRVCIIGKPENQKIFAAFFNEDEFKKQVQPSKNTELVIVCNTEINKNVSNKISTLKRNGYSLNIMSETDAVKHIKENTLLSFMKKPEKKLDITYTDLFDESNVQSYINLLQTDIYLHNLGNKEIYIHADIKNKDLLSQCLGNLGAFPTYSLDESTNYIWLDEVTIDKLRNGEKTNLITTIENFYNQSKSISFIYEFIVENNIYDFIENRFADGRDEILMDLFEKYKEAEYARMDEQYSNMHEQYKFGNKHFVKHKGVYYFKLEDGRVWAPSRQAEP